MAKKGRFILLVLLVSILILPFSYAFEIPGLPESDLMTELDDGTLCVGCRTKAIDNYCTSISYESGYDGICRGIMPMESGESFEGENVCCYIDEPEEIINLSSLQVHKRSLKSNIYYNQTSGIYFAEVHSNPINYFNGSEFKPIDTQIRNESCELDYCVIEGPYQANFKFETGSGTEVKFYYDNSYVELTFGGIQYEGNNNTQLISEPLEVVASVEGDSITFPSVYGEGIDLKYRYQEDLLKEDLIIDSLFSLPDPEGNLGNDPYFSILFKIKSETINGQNREDNSIYISETGERWNENSELMVDSGIEFKDDLQNIRAGFTKGYAVDNNDDVIRVDYALRKIEEEKYLAVRVPYSWLESAEFPVRIDPPLTSPNITTDWTNYVQWDWWDDDVDGDNQNLNLNNIASDALTSGERCTFGNVEFDIKEDLPANSTIHDVDLYMLLDTIDDSDCNNNVDIFLDGYHEDGYPHSLPSDLQDLNENIDYVDEENLILGGYLNLDEDDENEWQVQDTGDDGNALAEDILADDPNNDNSLGVFMRGVCWEDTGVGNDCWAQFEGNSAPTEEEPYLIIQYTPPCTIPDGSSESCECDTDNDCPNGYMCEQRSGYDACILDVQCSGNISVIVEDSSGNPLQNSYVWLNGVNKGQTDSFGVKDLSVPNVDCGSPQVVQVRCSDNVEICGNQTTTIDQTPDYDSLSYICDMCLSNYDDLYITDDDISFRDHSSGDTNISVLVHTVNIEASNVDVDIFRFCDNGLFRTRKTISTVTSSQTYLLSTIEDLDDCDKVLALADSTAEISESDETNNAGQRFVIDPVDAYLNIDSEFSLVDDEMEEFLLQYVNPVSQADAELEIYVGRRLGPPVEDGWGKRLNLVVYNDQIEGIPYNGIIGKRFDGLNDNPRLYVFGNEIDGTIAALRELKDQQHIFLDANNLDDEIDPVYLNEQNLEAITVFDYLHNDENQDLYRQNSLAFAQIVSNVLREQIFNLAIKRVTTANNPNVTLRLKSINNELSAEYRDFVNARPIVLGHGLWGNLFSMEEYGLRLARDEKYDGQFIRDVWLMEYTGGPNTDCANCPVYDYDDLIDWYWPALVGGVLKYANVNSVDYVGYSAGGGVGINSYEKYYQGNSSTMGYYLNSNGQWQAFTLPANFVNHMTLITPMGAFDGTNIFTIIVDRCGEETLDELNDEHISKLDVIEAAIEVCPPSILDDVIDVFLNEFGDRLPPPGNEASIAFFADIIDLVRNRNDENPALSSINELLIIRGSRDFVIPQQDIIDMYENSNANEKHRARVISGHSNVPDKEGVYDPLSAKFLNDISYSTWERIIWIIFSE